MSKREFLEQMQDSRSQLNAVISGLTEDQMSQDIVAGEWTIKDILAHIAAWQSEMLIEIRRAAEGEDIGPTIEESADEWNRRRVEERRRLPLVDVMQEFGTGYDELVAALESAPEDHIPLGPGPWDATARLWWLTDHDLDHVAAIRSYRSRIADA